MRRAFLGLSLIAACALSAEAAVIADFSGGEGTTSVDQFRGIAGDGWAGGWVASAGSGTVATSYAVTNASPLNGGGNYLQQTLTVTAVGSGQSRNGVFRQYEDTGDVQRAGDLVFSFAFRIDEQFGFVNQYNDTIHFFDHASGSTSGSSGTTWQVDFQGNGNIQYRNGGSNVNSQKKWAVGEVYLFEITSYAATKTYDLTLTNLTTPANSVIATDLGWRNNAAAAHGGYLHIVPGTFVADGNLDDYIKVSLDSVAISAVPEPATLSLLALSGLTLLRRRK